jgi:hypothetical protein
VIQVTAAVAARSRHLSARTYFVLNPSLTGQTHERVKDLAPGTAIAGFTIDDGAPAGTRR